MDPVTIAPMVSASGRYIRRNLFIAAKLFYHFRWLFVGFGILLFFGLLFLTRQQSSRERVVTYALRPVGDEVPSSELQFWSIYMQEIQAAFKEEYVFDSSQSRLGEINRTDDFLLVFRFLKKNNSDEHLIRRRLSRFEDTAHSLLPGNIRLYKLNDYSSYRSTRLLLIGFALIVAEFMLALVIWLFFSLHTPIRKLKKAGVPILGIITLSKRARSAQLALSVHEIENDGAKKNNQVVVFARFSIGSGSLVKEIQETYSGWARTIRLDLELNYRTVRIGLSDYLAGEIEPGSLIGVDDQGLAYISRGTIGFDYRDVKMQSEKISQLMAFLKRHFDRILLDAPNLFVHPSALLWMDKDTSVIIEVSMYVRLPDFHRMIYILRRNQIPVQGYILTQVSDSVYINAEFWDVNQGRK